MADTVTVEMPMAQVMRFGGNAALEHARTQAAKMAADQGRQVDDAPHVGCGYDLEITPNVYRITFPLK